MVQWHNMIVGPTERVWLISCFSRSRQPSLRLHFAASQANSGERSRERRHAHMYQQQHHIFVPFQLPMCCR
jgi:hypothetical protein